MVGVKRSTGCSLCRKRKVRCDEKTPSCSQCLKGNRDCPGYQRGLQVIDQGPGLRKKYNTTQSLQRIETAENRIIPIQAFEQNALPKSDSRPYPLKSVTGFTQAISSGLANRQQLLALYIDGIFPAATTDYPVLLNWRWLSQVPAHFGINPVLDLAAQSVIISYFGRQMRDTSFIHASREFYGQALRYLQFCLKDPEMSRASETLCATMLLTTYEIINCTRVNSWVRHAGGAGSLMLMRGPERHKSGFDFDLMMASRQMTVVESLATNKPSYFGKAEWRGLGKPPLGISAKRLECFNLGDALFHFLVEISKLVHFATNDSAAKGPSYRDAIIRIQEAMDEWYQRFLIHTGGPTIIATEEASKIVPVSYKWANTSLSSPACTYHVARLILLELAGAPNEGPEATDHVAEICKNFEYAQKAGLIGAQYICFAVHVAWGHGSAEVKNWLKRKLDELGTYYQIANELQKPLVLEDDDTPVINRPIKA